MADTTEEQLISRMRMMNSSAAETCIAYIEGMLNTESLRGNINEFEYRKLLPNAIDGLFTLIYLNFYDIDNELQDSLFFAAQNLLILKMTRVRNGLDYHLEEKRVEAQKPNIIQR